MKKINLRDLYPFYHNDLFVEISDEVAAALAEAERMERNYIRRVYWNKAYFSLDAGTVLSTKLFLLPCLPVSFTSARLRRRSSAPL